MASTKFKTRNLYHLRISAHSVLPLYLYLDERHLGWMSDPILQMVLSDLRPLILPKLQQEQNVYMGPAFSAPTSAKKGSVDVHRGASYQFAYFFRKAEPHSVLLKTRRFVVDPKKEADLPKEEEDQLPPTTGKRKRGKRSATKQSTQESIPQGPSQSTPAATTRPQRTRTTRQTAEQPQADEEDDPIETFDDDDDIYMPNADDEPDIRGTQQSAIKIEDGEEANATLPTRDPPLFVDDIEPDDEKPKLSVRLKYQGFSIFGRCLCVVVEPWPPLLRSQMTRETATPMREETPALFRGSTPIDVDAPPSFREATPLFLPEDTGRETPAPFINQQRPRREFPPVPLFHEMTAFEDDENDEFDMLQLSQIIRDTGGDRGGSDGEDSDGGVLLGDADEDRAIY